MAAAQVGYCDLKSVSEAQRIVNHSSVSFDFQNFDHFIL